MLPPQVTPPSNLVDSGTTVAYFLLEREPSDWSGRAGDGPFPGTARTTSLMTHPIVSAWDPLGSIPCACL